MPKDRLKDFKKITEEALNDATTKMIDCKLENQGLMKELNLLRLVNEKWLYIYQTIYLTCLNWDY